MTRGEGAVGCESGAGCCAAHATASKPRAFSTPPVRSCCARRAARSCSASAADAARAVSACSSCLRSALISRDRAWAREHVVIGYCPVLCSSTLQGVSEQVRRAKAHLPLGVQALLRGSVVCSS